MTNNSTSLSKNAASSRNADNPALLDNWRRLNLSIKGRPNQFQQHTQRILFAIQNDLHEYLPGALQDLFIALGKNGRSLRERMYSLSVPLIDHNDREYFHQWLANDSDATLECHRFPGSVLVSQLCRTSSTDTDDYLLLANGSTIEKGRHAIAYGRVEAAESLLEAACDKKNPETSCVEELMSLYAATRQKEKLTTLVTKLQKQRFTLSKHWKQVLESSKEW